MALRSSGTDAQFLRNMQKLANALYKLSDKEREVILLRYFQSMRDKEITDLYQVSRSAIYRRRSNGLKKLKTLLKERN